MEFQSYAYGTNHWLADPDLRAVLERVWPEVTAHEAELAAFGALAGREAYEVAYHVDHDAPPVLVNFDLDGERVDRVRLSPAERDLLQRLAPMMRPPFEGGSWHHHFAQGYLLADPGLYCVLTITLQTAYALHKYAPEQRQLETSLLALEAFGATWMTETQGGSDLGANRTVASRRASGWRLSGGDKYFASGAGLADVAIVTARPEGAPAGPKGLALFLVPRLDAAGSLNFRVRRLKDKSATRAVPSGEVELEDSHAELIGVAGEGIYYTLETLTVSRLANAVASMGIARKAALEVEERVRRRSAFGRVLAEHPLVRRDLLELAVRQAGGLALAFHAVDAFDKAWHDRPPYSDAYHYARFLGYLAKNRTADHAADVSRLAMELFGGLGFLEEAAVARWHREALITPIWEGPSNIQALDMLEVMQKKAAHRTFVADMRALLQAVDEPEARLAESALGSALASLEGRPDEEAQWLAKDVLAQLADVAQVALLYALDRTRGGRYAKLARLYASRFLAHEPFPTWALGDPDLWPAVAPGA
ncbi:MAG: acyl-CoA dehydrogenase family protein [Deinococcales bacterium]